MSETTTNEVYVSSDVAGTYWGVRDGGCYRYRAGHPDGKLSEWVQPHELRYAVQHRTRTILTQQQVDAIRAGWQP